MAWDPIDESELRPGFAILNHVRQAWNCLKWLYGQIGTQSLITVQNGSFEVDSDSDGQPDNWTLSTYPGGSGSVITDVPPEGIRALGLVHPGGSGNGGGYYESDYVICSSLVQKVISFVHWSTAAGMHNRVAVRFFDKSKVFLSTTVLYDSTANPTIPTNLVAAFTPPATSRYFKIDLFGGMTDANVAGTAYFDAVAFAGLEATAIVSAPISIASTTGFGAWGDAGSATIQVPFCNMPVVLSLEASLSGGNLGTGVIAHQRFRIGSSYSNEVFTVSSVVSRFLLPFVTSSGGMQSFTIHQQLKTEGGGTASGAVSDAGSGVRINL